MTFRMIDVGQITSRGNLRHLADGEIPELARSIQNLGLLQPIIVRKDGQKYVCIAGHRRLAAVRMRDSAESVPCVVVEADEQQAKLIQLGENIHRFKLTAKEIVAAIDELRKNVPDMTQDEAAQLIGKPASWVKLQYRAAGAFDKAVKAGASPKDLAALPSAHLMRLQMAPKKAQKTIAKQAHKEDWSARQVYVAAKEAKHEEALAFASDQVGEAWTGRFGVYVYDSTTVVLKLKPVGGDLVQLKRDLMRLGGSLAAVRPTQYPPGSVANWGKGGRGRRIGHGEPKAG